MHETFGAPGAERKQLDIGLRPATSKLPTIIVQSCIGGDYDDTKREMEQWLGAGKGMVQKVILLQWTEKPGGDDEVDCKLEIFSSEVYGNKPCREYKAVGIHSGIRQVVPVTVPAANKILTRRYSRVLVGRKNSTSLWKSSWVKRRLQGVNPIGFPFHCCGNGQAR